MALIEISGQEDCCTSERYLEPPDPALADGADGLALKLWRLDAAALARLRQLWPVVEPVLDLGLEDGFLFMQGIPELAPHLAEPERLAGVKRLQREHWVRFFQGHFDRGYHDKLAALGRVHARIGLTPAHYLASCAQMLETMIEALTQRHRWRPLQIAEQAGLLVRAVMMEAELVTRIAGETRSAVDTQASVQELAEQFEQELDAAIEFVRRGAAGLETVAETVLASARTVQQDSEHVIGAWGHANDNAHAIAQAAEQLSSSIAEISSQADRSTAAAEVAAREADEARSIAGELAGVSQRIGAIVQLIERIAKETRLLALNANIEAARAGEYGRGFAVVATEVKTLADQTSHATDDIRSEIQAMQQAIQAAATAIGGVAERVQVVTANIAGIAAAVTQQRTATRHIATSVQAAAESIEGVHQRLTSVGQAADASTREATSLRELTHGMVEQVVGIKRRVIATLRSSRHGNRRAEERTAVDRPVTCRLEGRSWPGRTDNLSPGGAQIRDPALAASANLVHRRLTLELPEIGSFAGEVVAAEGECLHVHFLEADQLARRRLADLLERCRREDQELMALAQATAAAVSAAFEQALERRELAWDDLWDADYQPVPGSDPAQFTTRFLPLCDRLLPAIQEPLLGRHTRITFVAAVDRNGYLPTHNRQYSEPQRPGERAWNTAHCRNRRIFDDRTGLAAARNLQPVLVQTYRRDMGQGELVTMKDISAPILIKGQHWGGLRIGCRS